MWTSKAKIFTLWPFTENIFRPLPSTTTTTTLESSLMFCPAEAKATLISIPLG